MPVRTGTGWSEEPEPDNPVRGREDDLLDIVAGQVMPPYAPHEFRIGGGHPADGPAQFLQGDEPFVPRLVGAVAVHDRECEAPHRDRPPLASGEIRERMVRVRVLHLDLVGVSFDECHDVPVSLVVHFRHVT